MTRGTAIASLVTLLGRGRPTPSPTQTYPHVARDYDGDGSTSDVDCNDAVAAMNWRDEDGDGQATCGGDCDDFDPVLNTLDEDGDGADTCTWRPDCDDHDADRNWDDQDGDGASTCDDPADCADEDPLIGPEVPPACGDGIDNNCDGYGDCRLQGELDPASLSAGAVLSGWGAASGGLDARDVNADGVADLLLWSSSVAVFHGPLLDLRSTADAVATLDVATMYPRPKLGDVTGDGLGDIVYAENFLNGPSVYTVVPGPLVGALAPWNTGLEVRVSGSNDLPGEISLVDATNDGAIDLLIGNDSTVVDANGTWNGCLYIVPGPITAPKDATDVWHRSCHATPGANLAQDFDVIENWDGTGIATVASLAPGLLVGLHDGLTRIDGAVYLLQPQPGEFDVDLAADLRIIDTGVHEIDFLQAVGDTNGDGYDDVVLGEGSLYTDDATERSTIRPVLGGAGLLGEVDLVSSPDHLVHSYTAAVLGAAGDVDGNGTDDLLLYVDSGLVGSTILVYTPIQGAMDLDGTSALFVGATSARSAGDINGDGMGDLYMKSEALDDGDPLVTTILGVPDGL